jgi:siroheme synthase
VRRDAAHVSGSLVVVGAGIGFARITLEARAAIAAAEEVLYLVPDPVSATGIEALNPSARSLHTLYGEGGPHRAAYERMTEAILEPVRAGKRVCAAFYGHPGVFVLPSHDAIKRARAEGFQASMLPGVSAEDCLVADLGVDPGVSGLQSYEATDFLRRRPAIELTAALVLWQIGVTGARTLSANVSAPALGELVSLLLERYPAGHGAVVYEASSYPGVKPLIRNVRLEELGAAPLTPASTLYVPPVLR